MDSTEQLITDSLSKHAADAPSDDRLLDAVHARLHRRRTGRALGAVVVAAAAVATAFTASHTQLHTDPQIAQTLPAGWHWESFKTVQVQVPSTWTQYISGPAPCTLLTTPSSPTIGRLDGWPESRRYTCSTAVLPLSQRRQYLWFGDVQAPGITRYDGGWIEETRVVGGVKLSVLTKDDALRNKILDSARPITGTDPYGCSPQRPARGPNQPPDLAGQVTSASICEYWNGSLIAGSAVPADKLLELSAQVLAALQLRSVPLAQAGCNDPAAREFVVLLHSGNKTQPVHLSYSVCSPVTRAAMTITLTGPHNQLEPAKLFDPPKSFKPPHR
ncbi:hypothetical protein [Kribbella sp. NPDC048928]|uniref:hypothetical protein n=1 Tax=Kribbella sp. NPDC048928 TaxID=3364111 RepID=UPI003715BC4C